MIEVDLSSYIGMIGNLGFPIAVTSYLLIRFENKITDLSDAIEKLTGGQMLYDATIGTVEEVIDTAVWGTKMIFDVDDTREKFDEKINETGGMANYLGEQGALLAGGAVLPQGRGEELACLEA